MSSDSSEDEDLEKFSESIDKQLINDSMFNGKFAQHEEKQIKLQSLRPKKDDDVDQIAVGFEAYASKHLVRLCDEILKKKLRPATPKFSEQKPKKRKGGIKLFHNSTNYIKKNRLEVQRPFIRPFKNSNMSDDEDTEKLQSVAVEPDDILQKKEIKHWSNRSKAPIYHYKNTNSGLIEIVKPFQ